MIDSWGGDVHSAQFGELAIVAVICLFNAFSVGDEVSTMMTSCLLLGGRVKRIGMDDIVLVTIPF